MAESIHTYETVIAYPLETVWAALHRTVDLDLQGGMSIHERISDSEWTTKLQNRTTRCSTTFDEATHSATVAMKVDIRRHSDTVVLTAVPTEYGTRVGIAFLMHANALLVKFAELLGDSSYQAIANGAFANITALCENRSTHIMDQDELAECANKRVQELQANEAQ
ncbi:MAG: hypothetical protein RR619_11535 [Raoultibacter sp.]